MRNNRLHLILLAGLFLCALFVSGMASQDYENPPVDILWKPSLEPAIMSHLDTIVHQHAKPADLHCVMQGTFTVESNKSYLRVEEPHFGYISVYPFQDDTLILYVTFLKSLREYHTEITADDIRRIQPGDTIVSKSSVFASVNVVVKSLNAPLPLAQELRSYYAYACALMPPDKGVYAPEMYEYRASTDSLLPDIISTLPMPYHKQNDWKLRRELVESEEYKSHTLQAFEAAKQHKFTNRTLSAALLAIGDTARAFYLFRRTDHFVCGTGWQPPGYILPDAAHLATSAGLADFSLALNCEILVWVSDTYRNEHEQWVTVEDLERCDVDVFSLMLGANVIVDGNGSWPLRGNALTAGSHLAKLETWKSCEQRLLQLVKNQRIDIVNRVVCLNILLSLWHHVELRENCSLDTSHALADALSTFPKNVYNQLTMTKKSR